ncbi:MAG: hypothetical protein GX596_14900 [Propionibacterium sp.]|nr:hypothetical protein [Propionibacterium sp.]
MSTKPWRPVSPKLRMRDIIPTQLLVYNDRRAAVVDIKRSKRNHVEARVQEIGGRPHHQVFAAGDRVELLCRQLVGSKARAIGLPPVLWNAKGRSSPARDLTSASSGVLVATALITLVPIVGVVLGLGAGFIVGVMVRGLWPGHVEPGLTLLGHPGIAEGDLHERALAIERGFEFTDEAAVAPDPDPGPAERVARVREAYGALRTDLVYRIEHPALFDPKEPTTAAFERALAAFGAAGAGAATGRSAGEVEVAFNVARQNAERRGLRHVEQVHRAAVRRAAKAARLAARAATDGERVASLTQVRRILDSVALYYLPSSTDEVLAIGPPR